LQVVPRTQCAGSTLCAIDDDSLVMATVFGDVNGESGVDASDAVVSSVATGGAAGTPQARAFVTQ